MRKISVLSALLHAVAIIALAQGAGSRPVAQSGPPPSSLLPSSDHDVVLLWPDGAPGSEGNTAGEKFRIVGDKLVVSNVHQPSITLYLPPSNLATGAAVIVAPGGSFRELWITHEGYGPADWLAQRGIAAFVLKYRLQRSPDSTYTTMDH